MFPPPGPLVLSLELAPGLGGGFGCVSLDDVLRGGGSNQRESHGVGSWLQKHSDSNQDAKFTRFVKTLCRRSPGLRVVVARITGQTFQLNIGPRHQLGCDHRLAELLARWFQALCRSDTARVGI